MVKSLLPNFAALVCVEMIVTGCARFQAPAEIPAPAASEQLRELPLTGPGIKADMLYLLLTAEIAGQRGDYELALRNYLEVAEKVPDPWVAQRATQIAFYLKDTENAQRAVALWLERDPHSLDAHKAALMLALQRDDTEAGIAHFSQVLKLAGEDRSNVLLEMLRFMDRGVSKETALQMMAAISAQYAQSPEVLYAYAMLALRKGEIQLALEQISRAVALRPDWPRLRLMQGQLLAHLGEESKAQEILKELAQKHPEDVQLRLLYAQLLLKRRAYDEALLELKRILKRDPANPDALYAHALISLQRGEDKVADRSLRRLIQQPKWRSEAYFYLGRIAARRGQDAEALSWFDRIREGDLAFDAQVNAVAVLVKLGRTREALQRMTRLRERFPERKLQLYLLEAEIQANQKDHEAAFMTLTRGLGDFPEDPDLLYARALVAEQMGKVDVAIADLRSAVAQRPEDANLLNALGYTLLVHTGQIGEARRYLDKAIRLEPDDAAIMDSYGWLWYKLGDNARALEYLQRAYTKNPDPEIGAHLGEVLWAMGRRQEARRLWRKIIGKPPHDERVKTLIERFRDRLEP